MNLFLLLACAHAPPAAAVDAPLPSPSVWSLRAADAETTPPQLRELMDQYFDVRLLVQTQATAEGLTLLFAPSTDGASQDLCGPSTRWAGVAQGADGFTASGPAVVLRTEKLLFHVDDLVFEGALDAGGLRAKRINGMLDTRPLAPMIDDGNPLAICSALGGVLPCQPCADGSQSCWSVALGAVSLTPVEGALVERSPEQIAADPACAAP